MKVAPVEILKILVTLLLILIMVDPVGSLFHAKESLFIVVIFSYVCCFCRGSCLGFSPKALYLSLFVMFLPFYGIFIAQLRNSFLMPEYAGGQLKSFLFVLLLPVFSIFRKDWLIKLIARIGLIIVGIIFFCYALAFINPLFFERVYDFLVWEKKIALISMRDIMGFPILAIFYKTSPIIFFSLAYYIYQKSKISKLLALCCFFALFFTGSRVPMLGALFIILFPLVKRIPNINVRLYLGLVGLLLIIFLVYLFAGEKDEVSNVVKYANFSSYIESWSDPFTFIGGKGLGSVFYALGRNQYVTHSELTYFDLLRIYGFPLATCFMIAVFLPCLYVFKRGGDSEKKHFFIAYFCYMVLAGTNPLLISSTGMCIFCLGWSLILPVKAHRQCV